MVRQFFCITKQCKKYPADNLTNLCRKHGGGYTCTVDECVNAAVIRSKFCRAHVYRSLCTQEGCTKYSAQPSLKCFRHRQFAKCVAGQCSRQSVGAKLYCSKHSTNLVKNVQAPTFRSLVVTNNNTVAVSPKHPLA